MFVYSKQYKAQNGRGYIILEPMQDEIKRFEPQPLSTLRNLNIAIQRPSGALFNESRDNFGVARIEWESFNEYFLKVVLDAYFDRNEFYRGDTVAFQGVSFQSPDDGTPKPFPLNMLEDFINRREGHEIVHMDPTNEDGYRRSFHVYAPGSVDQKAGRLVLNSSMIKALVRYNEKKNDDGGDDSHNISGHVINMSLQNVISFRVWMKRASIAPMLNVSSADTVPTYSE